MVITYENAGQKAAGKADAHLIIRRRAAGRAARALIGAEKSSGEVSVTMASTSVRMIRLNKVVPHTAKRKHFRRHKSKHIYIHGSYSKAP